MLLNYLCYVRCLYSDDAYNSLYQLIEDVRFPTIATAIISIIT